VQYTKKFLNEFNCLYDEPINSSLRIKNNRELRSKIDSVQDIVILSNGESSEITSYFCRVLIKNLNAKASFVADHGFLRLVGLRSFP